MPIGSPDLHGSVPDDARVALLLIDVVNDLEFGPGARLLAHALPMAERIAALKRRARDARIPTVYVNDNFGRLAGLTAEGCVLCTATDAYMRDYRLLVPSDCVASVDPDDCRRALEHMQRVLKADTRPAGERDLAELTRR